jgi:hypothetical protein
MQQKNVNESAIDYNANLLLIVGGVAALIAAIIFRRNLSAEYFLFRTIGFFPNGPTELPVNINDWFILIRNSKFYGLLFLNLFDLINYILIGLMYAGLYQTLKKFNKSLIVIAMLFILVGITIYFATNQAFAMLALSDKYFHAVNESERSALLAAGQALLAIHNINATYSGTYITYFFVTFGGLLCAIVMLQSKIYGKITAVIGIVATAFGLGFYVTALIVPALNVIPVAGSAPFLMVWYILVGFGMIRHGKNINKSVDNP